MSKFLKLKDANTDQRVLVAVDSIAFVNEGGSGSVVTIKATGEEITVKEGYQTLVNRLTKGDDESAEG